MEHQRLRVPLGPPLCPVLRIRKHPGHVPPRWTHRSPPPRTRRLRCDTAQSPALRWETPAYRPGRSPWETPPSHHHCLGPWLFRGRRRQAATSESQNRLRSSRPERGAVFPLCILLTPPGPARRSSRDAESPFAVTCVPPDPEPARGSRRLGNR